MKITLAAARVNAGYKQGEAAKLIKVAHRTLCNWEQGKYDPPIGKVLEMCELYGCNIDNLRWDVNENASEDTYNEEE